MSKSSDISFIIDELTSGSFWDDDQFLKHLFKKGSLSTTGLNYDKEEPMKKVKKFRKDYQGSYYYNS